MVSCVSVGGQQKRIRVRTTLLSFRDQGWIPWREKNDAPSGARSSFSLHLADGRPLVRPGVPGHLHGHPGCGLRQCSAGHLAWCVWSRPESPRGSCGAIGTSCRAAAATAIAPTRADDRGLRVRRARPWGGGDRVPRTTRGDARVDRVGALRGERLLHDGVARAAPRAHRRPRGGRRGARLVLPWPPPDGRRLRCFFFSREGSGKEDGHSHALAAGHLPRLRRPSRSRFPGARSRCSRASWRCWR